MNILTFTKLSGFSSIFFIPRHAHSVKCKHDSESTFFLISESESGSTLGPTWSVFVTFLPKNENGGARFLSSPLSELIHSCPSKKVRVKITEHFAKSICYFGFPSQKVKLKVHFVWLDPSLRLLPSEESFCAISGQVLGGWAGSTDT